MKHIVLVDDSCKLLGKIFISISSMIFDFYKTHENAEQEHFKITWIHVLNEDQPTQDSFVEVDIMQGINEIIRGFCDEQGKNNLPSIEFQCIEVMLSPENEASDVKEKAQIIKQKIDEVINGNTGFVLLIDLVIYDRNDVELEMKGLEIISEALFSEYSKNAIPYSNYDTASAEEAKFRRLWKKRQKVDKIFDKKDLCDAYFYNDLYLDLLYSKLGLN